MKKPDMPLPTFILCGAPKAGTTAVYAYLSAHRNICMSIVKEPDYFSKNYGHGIDWYAEHFRHFDSKQHKAIGEASPGYLSSPEAPERIAAVIPAARLIFLLRNPIDRAFSQYWFGIMRGTNDPTRTFGDLIRDLNDPWGRRIIDLGMYGTHIMRYERAFDKSQMLPLLYDRLLVEPEIVYGQISNFIGVEHCVSISAQREVNRTLYPSRPTFYRALQTLWHPIKKRVGHGAMSKVHPIRSAIRAQLFAAKKPKMSEADRAYLAEIYEDSNRTLASYLNIDLSHWN